MVESKNPSRGVCDLLHKRCRTIVQLVDKQVVLSQLRMQRVNTIIMLSSQLPNRNHKVVEFLDHRLDHLWRQGTLPLLCGIEGNQTTRSSYGL